MPRLRADCCVSVRGEARSCNCLALLADKPNVVDSIALALQMHFDLDESNKKCQLVAEKRHADRLTKGSKLGRSPKPFQLPMFVGQLTGEEDDDFHEDIREAMEHGICLSAWTTLYNIGRKALEKIRSIVSGMQSMVHGNTGKRNIDEGREDAYQNIIDVLRGLEEEESTPFAVRTVRDSAGRSSLRDNNDYVYLSPAFSKRRCYLEICHKRGWVAVWLDKHKQKFKPIREWNLREGFYRTQEEAVLGRGEVAKRVVSRRSFLRCWAENFPKLKVRAKGEDTCTDCYLLNQKLARIARQKAELLEQLDDGELDGITPEDLNAEIEGYQEVIDECKKHVDMHTAQRAEYNRFLQLSKEALEQQLPADLFTMMRSSTWPKTVQHRF